MKYGEIIPQGSLGTFVSRGDFSGWDFSETGDKSVLNTDWTWRELDLSSIIPEGTKSILIYILVRADAPNRIFAMKKKGFDSNNNSININTQVANISICQDSGIVEVDEDRIVLYRGTDIAFAEISLGIRGWWI